MNFLAHFLLGSQKEEYILGNFLGDFVKGHDYEKYNFEVKKGILMHREIDSFADTHPDFIKTKRVIFHRYRHYAGVIVDVYYDFFLSKNWEKYSDIPLETFIANTYDVLSKYETVMPFSAQVAFKYMQQGDWLTRYTNYDGVSRTFLAMSKHIKRKSGMETAIEELLLFEKAFDEDFQRFFPAIQNKIKEWSEAYNR